MAPSDYDALIDLAGTAELVMIGEASHGTHEFYETRAELTKRLIAEKQHFGKKGELPDTFPVGV